MLFLHRNSVGGSQSPESADDLLLDVSDDELWHNNRVLSMIALRKGVWHGCTPSRHLPGVTQRTPDDGGCGAPAKIIPVRGGEEEQPEGFGVRRTDSG